MSFSSRRERTRRARAQKALHWLPRLWWEGLAWLAPDIPEDGKGGVRWSGRDWKRIKEILWTVIFVAWAAGMLPPIW